VLVERRCRNLAPFDRMLPATDDESDEKVLTLCASQTLEASSDRMED
jgi:hypothetical protein